jgi:hypothetical protein
MMNDHDIPSLHDLGTAMEGLADRSGLPVGAIVILANHPDGTHAVSEVRVKTSETDLARLLRELAANFDPPQCDAVDDDGHRICTRAKGHPSGHVL